ncbi:MAG: glycosyltransferase family 4 protein [Nitrospira sp.]|jgi:UDP-glucose:(heptosyl)LPS alpha-1,3-glucosyltransferase|nr:glycosyltransferase family 4 protein [Nitrospira sp.]
MSKVDHLPRLKIAVLIKRFLRTGGAEKYAMEVVRRLAVAHDVHVFAHEWIFDGSEPITFHKIPRVCHKPAWVNQLFFSYFCRRAVDDGFDVVHSFEKVPTFDVMTVQSPCFKSPELKGLGRWQQRLDWVRTALSPRKLAWRWLEARQFADEGARVIIAVAEKVKRNVQACYGLSDDHFQLAYTGVDVPKIERVYSPQELHDIRAQLGLSADDLVLLFVGTEFKRKGLDALLGGLALLPRGMCKLLIAGGGGGKLDYYKQLAAKIHLESDVRFLGLVQDIERMYPIADLYVLPTLADPCPLAPLEAMAAGVATIMSAPDFNGSAELIQNGEALLLSNPRDPKEIAQAVMSLTDSRARQELAEKGRALVRQFTWDKTAEETLSAYRSVLRRKGVRGQPCLEMQGVS